MTAIAELPMLNRLILNPGDRAILVGASGEGKSTLAEWILRKFRENHPQGRIAVLDTKPRWRAEYLANGTKAASVYKAFAKGDTIPGSMQLSTMRDWPLAWDKYYNPSRTVIVQNLNLSDADNIRFQTRFAERFFRTQTYKVPSLIYFDEGMDFFSTSAAAKGGSDIVQKCFRAGREKNLASCIGVQRPVGINIQCLTETNYCALFRINYESDVKRLYEMGWPKDTPPPTYEEVAKYGKGLFRLWREGAREAPFVRLEKNA